MKLPLIGLSFCLLSLGACSHSSTSSAPYPSADQNVVRTSSTPESTTPAPESLQETLKRYEQVALRMRPWEVEKILGKATKTEEINNDGEGVTQISTWQKLNGATISVQFNNDRVISKSQLGLVSLGFRNSPNPAGRSSQSARSTPRAYSAPPSSPSSTNSPSSAPSPNSQASPNSGPPMGLGI